MASKKGKKTDQGSDLPKAARPEDEMLVRCITAQPRNKKPVLSKEEIARREVVAKRYQKMTQIRDLYNKAEVDRREALLEFGLRALPLDEDRVKVRKEPGFAPPMHRQMWTWTPPKEI